LKWFLNPPLGLCFFAEWLVLGWQPGDVAFRS